MPVKFNAYPPDRPALVRVLDEDDNPHRIGRSNDCELRIDHPSISRYHAELVAGSADSPWKLRDTGSKNGLRIDGRATLSADFTASAWFAIGDVYCWIEFIDAAAAAHFRAQATRLREVSREALTRITSHLETSELVAQTLDMVLELSGLERGFVLVAPAGEPLRVHVCRGLATSDLSKGSFSGSVASVEQALNRGEPVVCCDTTDSPWLGLRPSVRLGGIRALVCLPLQMSDGARGAIYVDSRKPGPAVTELDLELMQSVARFASSAITANRLQSEVQKLMRSGDLDEVAPRWDELRPL